MPYGAPSLAVALARAVLEGTRNTSLANEILEAAELREHQRTDCPRCRTSPPSDSWELIRETYRWRHTCPEMPLAGSLPFGPPQQLRCSICGKTVSNTVPFNTIVRAVVVCPECIETGRVVVTEEPEAAAPPEGDAG